jgi:hypothetical protein
MAMNSMSDWKIIIKAPQGRICRWRGTVWEGLSAFPLLLAPLLVLVRLTEAVMNSRLTTGIALQYHHAVIVHIENVQLSYLT